MRGRGKEFSRFTFLSVCIFLLIAREKKNNNNKKRRKKNHRRTHSMVGKNISSEIHNLVSFIKRIYLLYIFFLIYENPIRYIFYEKIYLRIMSFRELGNYSSYFFFTRSSIYFSIVASWVLQSANKTKTRHFFFLGALDCLVYNNLRFSSPF